MASTIEELAEQTRCPRWRALLLGLFSGIPPWEITECVASDSCFGEGGKHGTTKDDAAEPRKVRFQEQSKSSETRSPRRRECIQRLIDFVQDNKHLYDFGYNNKTFMGGGFNKIANRMLHHLIANQCLEFKESIDFVRTACEASVMWMDIIPGVQLSQFVMVGLDMYVVIIFILIGCIHFDEDPFVPRVLRSSLERSDTRTMDDMRDGEDTDSEPEPRLSKGDEDQKGNQGPPKGDENKPPPKGRVDQKGPPKGNEDQPPPNCNKDQPPPNCNEDQPPPKANENKPPPKGRAEKPPPKGNGNQKGNQVPPDVKEDQRPPPPADFMALFVKHIDTLMEQCKDLSVESVEVRGVVGNIQQPNPQTDTFSASELQYLLTKPVLERILTQRGKYKEKITNLYDEIPECQWIKGLGGLKLFTEAMDGFANFVKDNIRFVTTGEITVDPRNNILLPKNTVKWATSREFEEANENAFNQMQHFLQQRKVVDDFEKYAVMPEYYEGENVDYIKNPLKYSLTGGNFFLECAALGIQAKDLLDYVNSDIILLCSKIGVKPELFSDPDKFEEITGRVLSAAQEITGVVFRKPHHEWTSLYRCGLVVMDIMIDTVGGNMPSADVFDFILKKFLKVSAGGVEYNTYFSIDMDVLQKMLIVDHFNVMQAVDKYTSGKSFTDRSKGGPVSILNKCIGKTTLIHGQTYTYALPFIAAGHGTCAFVTHKVTSEGHDVSAEYFDSLGHDISVSYKFVVQALVIAIGFDEAKAKAMPIPTCERVKQRHLECYLRVAIEIAWRAIGRGGLLQQQMDEDPSNASKCMRIHTDLLRAWSVLKMIQYGDKRQLGTFFAKKEEFDDILKRAFRKEFKDCLTEPVEQGKPVEEEVRAVDDTEPLGVKGEDQPEARPVERTIEEKPEASPEPPPAEARRVEGGEKSQIVSLKWAELKHAKEIMLQSREQYPIDVIGSMGVEELTRTCALFTPFITKATNKWVKEYGFRFSENCVFPFLSLKERFEKNELTTNTHKILLALEILCKAVLFINSTGLSSEHVTLHTLIQFCHETKILEKAKLPMPPTDGLDNIRQICSNITYREMDKVLQQIPKTIIPAAEKVLDVEHKMSTCAVWILYTIVFSRNLPNLKNESFMDEFLEDPIGCIVKTSSILYETKEEDDIVSTYLNPLDLPYISTQCYSLVFVIDELLCRFKTLGEKRANSHDLVFYISDLYKDYSCSVPQ